MSAGRPRAFDLDDALEKAMVVFWEKGFEGASLPDLTAAMGINRPSLYAAFGNKEALFQKALARYSESAVAFFRERLDVPKLRDAIAGFLSGAASSYACKETPAGCFSVQSALVGSREAQAVCQETMRSRESIVSLLKDRFDRAVHDGELKTGTETCELARFYTAVLQGMSVQSSGGTSKAELDQIVKLALRVLPA